MSLLLDKLFFLRDMSSPIYLIYNPIQQVLITATYMDLGHFRISNTFHTSGSLSSSRTGIVVWAASKISIGWQGEASVVANEALDPR